MTITANSFKWVQWTNKYGDLRAFAVDPDSVERTGKLRSINGSLIPADAEPAKSSTERDHFCLSIIERRANAPVKEPKVRATIKDGLAWGNDGSLTVVVGKKPVKKFSAADVESASMTKDNTKLTIGDTRWTLSLNGKRKAIGNNP